MKRLLLLTLFLSVALNSNAVVVQIQNASGVISNISSTNPLPVTGGEGPTGFASDPIHFTGAVSGTFDGGTATQPFVVVGTQTGVITPVAQGYATVGSSSATLFSGIIPAASYTVPCIIKISTTQDIRTAISGTATSTQQWLDRIVKDTSETYKLLSTTTFDVQYICGDSTATVSAVVYPIK